VLHCRAMARYLLLIGCALFIATGCDTGDRLAKLEKENQELQAEIKKRDNAGADLDFQAKCSKDGRNWFNENWAGSRDKNTILLDFRNHYNKKENKCFGFVEWHYHSNFAGPGGSSWTNLMSLWDIYENIKFGDFSQNTYTYWKPQPTTTTNEVLTCDVLNQKCKSVEEFNRLVSPYLND
jgi:hypothetical protein